MNKVDFLIKFDGRDDWHVTLAASLTVSELIKEIEKHVNGKITSLKHETKELCEKSYRLFTLKDVGFAGKIIELECIFEAGKKGKKSKSDKRSTKSRSRHGGPAPPRSNQPGSPPKTGAGYGSAFGDSTSSSPKKGAGGGFGFGGIGTSMIETASSTVSGLFSRKSKNESALAPSTPQGGNSMQAKVSVNVQGVDELADIVDTNLDADEVSDLLSGDDTEQFDDDELMAELDALDDSEISIPLTRIGDDDTDEEEDNVEIGDADKVKHINSADLDDIERLQDLLTLSDDDETANSKAEVTEIIMDTRMDGPSKPAVRLTDTRMDGPSEQSEPKRTSALPDTKVSGASAVLRQSETLRSASSDEEDDEEDDERGEEEEEVEAEAAIDLKSAKEDDFREKDRSADETRRREKVAREQAKKEREGKKTATGISTETAPSSGTGVAPSSSLAYFSGFAPPKIESNSTFVFNVWAYCKQQRAQVVAAEAQRGASEAGMKGPLRIKLGSLIEVELHLPSEAFELDDRKGTMEWEGEASNCSFAIKCKKSAKPDTYICKAIISVEGKERGALVCQFNVVRGVKQSSGNPLGKVLHSCAPFLFRGDNGSQGSGHEGLRPTPGPYFTATELQKQELLGVASQGRKSIRAVSPAVDLNGQFTIFPSSETPHIFLSYRRMHIDLADRIRRVFQDFGYNCFLDISKTGLEAGSFTEQLRTKLQKSAVVIPILTPAPAGKGEGREELSSLGWLKEAHKRGVTDWCHEELRMSLADKDKIIVPVFRGVDLSEEFRDLPSDIAGLPDLNCRQLHDDLFEQSVEVVHRFIQAQLTKREIATRV